MPKYKYLEKYRELLAQARADGIAKWDCDRAQIKFVTMGKWLLKNANTDVVLACHHKNLYLLCPTAKLTCLGLRKLLELYPPEAPVMILVDGSEFTCASVVFQDKNKRMDTECLTIQAL